MLANASWRNRERLKAIGLCEMERSGIHKQNNAFDWPRGLVF
jgi:hypothetical protein